METKTELQIKVALMECFCELNAPQSYGVACYAELLSLLKRAAESGDERILDNAGQHLYYCDEFCTLSEALNRVENYVSMLSLYDNELSAVAAFH